MIGTTSHSLARWSRCAQHFPCETSSFWCARLLRTFRDCDRSKELVKLCKDSSDRLPAHRASPQRREKTDAVQLSSALAAPATSSSRANCRGYLRSQLGSSGTDGDTQAASPVPRSLGDRCGAECWQVKAQQSCEPKRQAAYMETN